MKTHLKNSRYEVLFFPPKSGEDKAQILVLYRHYIDLGSLTVLPETFACMFTVFREFQSFYVLNSRRYFFNPINILKNSLV